MFIPHSEQPINIGDLVVAIKDIHVTGGEFTKGHQFLVIGIYKNNLGWLVYQLKDIDYNIIETVVQNYAVSLNLSYNECYNEVINKQQLEEKLQLIEDNCKYKFFSDYDLDDECEKCSLKMNNSVYCKVTLACDPVQLRKMKIDKVNK
jgi:hypothetical protein